MCATQRWVYLEGNANADDENPVSRGPDIARAAHDVLSEVPTLPATKAGANVESAGLCARCPGLEGLCPAYATALVRS